jgi:hypothetical protein
MTMSGASMRNALAPLVEILEERGFDLVAPDGGHRMTPSDLDEFLRWIEPVYRRRGRALKQGLDRSAFWEGHDNFDWLRSETLPLFGKKNYRALPASLARLGEATSGKEIEGVIAFSQGAVLATALASLGAGGDARFPLPKWAIYIAGFPPEVVEPITITYPIVAPYPRLFVIGERDPVFPTGLDHLSKWASCFASGTNEFLVAPCGHDVPRDPESVQALAEFVFRHGQSGP